MMPTPTLTDEPTLETAPRPAPATVADRPAARPYGWWAAAAVGLVGLLVVLAVAEADWLHHLPQDRASRVTLLALPADGPALAPDWPARLLEEATDPRLTADVVARLDLRDGATGQPLAPASLADDLRLGSECVEVRGGDGSARRGRMLTVVVRSDGAIDPDAVAQAWSARFTEHGRAAWPGLAIQPAMGVAYEICR
jgi:hypothetical protein